jgi:RimK-like ATP-grasp domain
VTRTTLLLLSGGSQVAQFMLQCLQGRRDALRLMATTSLADDPGLWQYDKVFLVPPTARQPEAYRQRVQEIIDREAPDLVIPCRDDDVAALAGMADARPGLWPRVLCGPAPLARAMHDKWSSFRLCAEQGLPFAESRTAQCAESAQDFAARLGFPLVAKPRDGFSSKGIFLIENDAQLQRVGERADYVLQEYLDSASAYWAFKREIEVNGFPLFHVLQGHTHKKVSIQLMFGPDSQPRGAFAADNQCLFRARRVRPSAEPDALALGEQSAQVFSRLGWRGPLNIQCQRDRDGRLKIHEFNGRYSALTAERWMLGYDEVALGLQLFCGVQLPTSNWASRPAEHAGAQLVSRASDPAAVAVLAGQGEWVGAGR